MKCRSSLVFQATPPEMPLNLYSSFVAIFSLKISLSLYPMDPRGPFRRRGNFLRPPAPRDVSPAGSSAGRPMPPRTSGGSVLAVPRGWNHGSPLAARALMSSIVCSAVPTRTSKSSTCWQ